MGRKTELRNLLKHQLDVILAGEKAGLVQEVACGWLVYGQFTEKLLTDEVSLALLESKIWEMKK